MLNAVGRSPEQVITIVSAERLGDPDAVSSAPPVVEEFSQPWPGLPLLAHGHAAPVPSPKQDDVNSSSLRSCMPLHTAPTAGSAPDARPECGPMKPLASTVTM